MASGLRSALVYDPALRLLHWTNALLVIVLLTSGLAAQWLEFGATASWRSMWQPQCWREVLRTRRPFIAPSRFGHHPVASAAYLAAYGLMGVLVISGLMLLAIKQGHGPLSPWLDRQLEYKSLTLLAHQVAAYGLLAFVGAHVSALALHHRFHHLPVARSMIDGIQYIPEKSA